MSSSRRTGWTQGKALTAFPIGSRVRFAPWVGGRRAVQGPAGTVTRCDLRALLDITWDDGRKTAESPWNLTPG